MNNRLLLKGASMLTASQLLIAACTFVRNIIVARFVSVEDYGIATAFALTMSLIEMTSNLAFDKILVQDEGGSGDRFVASTHFLQFLKSLLTALVLWATAAPMAHLFDLPSLSWAFQLLALIPLIKGVVHFDFITYQRKLDFKATAVMDAIPQMLTVALALPVSYWLQDYRAMLVLVLAQPICFIFLSHIYARRPYRWAVDKELIKKKVRFGWPLMIDGLLLFAIFHGDKTIVGATYGMEVLAWYGIAFSLTLLPSLLFSKICTTLLLPPLSSSREHPSLFLLFSERAATLCFALGIFIWAFFAIGGEALIFLSYGERYMEGALVITWLALMQSIRAIRIAPNMIATSQADTKNAMYSSTVRTVALPLAILCAIQGQSVIWLAITAIIGEVAAVIVSLYLLRMPETKPQFLRKFAQLSLIFVAICAAYSVLIQYLPTDVDDPIDSLWVVTLASIASGLAGLLMLATERSLRKAAMSYLQPLKAEKNPSTLGD